MKKEIAFSGLVVGILLTGVTVAADSNKQENEAVSSNEILSAMEVQEIALVKVEGNVEQNELENEDGRHFYEVEVENDEAEYDIYIDAYTGEVLFLKEDKKDGDDMEDEEMKQATLSNLIPELQAIEIAESVIEGTVVEMELDENDGQFVYELELKTSNGKAEVEINALTGVVLKKEVETRDMVEARER